MVTNGITYGASQLTSDGVSYTKNGETITVKKALDELINTSLTEIDSLKEHAKVYKYAELYDAVKVGDYVDYDAGEWTESSGMPTKQGEFGGYKSGQSKNESVACYEGTAPTYKGWRVLKKEAGKVYLVHAGQPECYFHALGQSNASMQLLQEHTGVYVDSKYATSDHIMTKDEAEKITGDTSDTSDDLRKTGANYWLATAYNTNGLWSVYAYGSINGRNSYAFGLRPVVELKKGILTTGKGTDKVGNVNAWIIA